MMNAFQSLRPRSVAMPSKRPRRLPKPRPEQYPVIGTPKIVLGLHGAPTMHQSKWHSGPPPHEGWWLTKTTKGGAGRKQAWRWWFGTYWSLAVRSGSTARVADRAAALANYRDDVVWCSDWPVGARVQRINPTTQEVTGG